MAVNTVQFAFRIRTDATAAQGGVPIWQAGQNINPFSWPITNLSPFRIRFSIENTGITATASSAWGIFVSKNAGAYTAVTTSSTFVKAVDATAGASANNSAISTSLLTGAAGTLQNGLYNDTGSSSALVLTNGDFMEVEFGLTFVSGIAVGDTYSFQVQIAGVALNTYTQTPTITINSIAIAQGSTATFSGTASTLAIPAPPNSYAVAGQLYYVTAVCSANATSPSCSDTKSNVYNLIQSVPFATNAYSLCTFYSNLTSSLIAGTDTTTVNFGVSSSLQVAAAMIAAGVNTLDVHPTGTTGSSTSPSIVSGTLANANEALFGVIGMDTATPSITVDNGNGWSFSWYNTGISTANVYIENQIVSATTSRTCAPTIASAPWGEVINSFYQSIALTLNPKNLVMM